MSEMGYGLWMISLIWSWHSIYMGWLVIKMALAW